jgi:hypothetical protein
MWKLMEASTLKISQVWYRADDARVVVDLQSDRVAPVMGFDSDGFFPLALDVDIDRYRTD